MRTRFAIRRPRYRSKARLSISIFTITLLTLTLIFRLYFILTVTTGSSCELALDWVYGWFEYHSPMQLFSAAFVAAGVIWMVRLLTMWRSLNFVETLLQLVLIVGCCFSLITVKAMIFPYATPTYEKIDQIVNSVFEPHYRLEEAYDDLAAPPPWPYDFPPPPPYPDYKRWFDGYSPDMREIFTSEDSPTLGEYAQLLQCAARYRQRADDRERAIDEYFAWRKQYGWRVGA